MELAEFWVGRLEGTNQGWALVKLSQSADGAIRGRVLVHDAATGAFSVAAAGHLDGNTLKLSLTKFKTRSVGVVFPPLGEVDLTLNDQGTEANGTWKTLAGTTGSCKLVPGEIGRPQWYAAVFSAWCRFVGQVLKWIFVRSVPWLYMAGLFALLVLSGTKRFDLGYPQMIIALTPAPFLFGRRIAELIRSWRITEIGPVKIQAPIVNNPELPWMHHLDFVLVPKTKQLLYWLGQYGTATRANFETTAKASGIPDDNVQNSWDALIQSQCATTDGSNLSITEFGRRYLDHVFPPTASPQ